MALFTCLLLSFQVQSQSDWELKKDESGIRVYTCKREGSSFKAFKVLTEIETKNIASIASAILDVENYINWMPDTGEAILIKWFDDSHDIHYVRTGAPWPLSDRDGVYEQKATYHEEENRVVIEINALKEYDYPKENKVVRMTVGYGFWEITRTGTGRFKIVYDYQADPGGNIPAWLANTSVVKIPHEMMVNLKEIIENGKYDDAQLDFIH